MTTGGSCNMPTDVVIEATTMSTMRKGSKIYVYYVKDLKLIEILPSTKGVRKYFYATSTVFIINFLNHN